MTSADYRVFVVTPERNELELVYSGKDEDEAIEVYEECRADTLFGVRVRNVHLIRGLDEHLARTDASWFGKIDPFKAEKVAAAQDRSKKRG